MLTFNTYTGKGIKENCGENREYIWFGKDFWLPDWPPDFPDASCGNMPTILGEAASFDFSTITPDHEAVGGLLNITDCIAGHFGVRLTLYKKVNSNWEERVWRETDLEIGAGGWIYVYWVVAWHPLEINENGDYKFVLTFLYDYSGYSLITKEFTVTGIVGHIPGHIWIEGESIHYIDEDGVERVVTYYSSSQGAGTPGYMWIDDYTLNYIDENGDKRYLSSVYSGEKDDGISGQMWIESANLYFIDGDGEVKRCRLD